MKNKGIRAIMLLVGFGLLFLVIGARPTPTSVTHLGVNPSDIVTLRGSYVDGVAKFVRVYSNGSTVDFSLPEGKALVVTDVECWGNLPQFGIKVNGERVYVGTGQVRERLVAGFVVSAPGILEIEIPDWTGWFFLRGYLTDDN